MIKAKKSVFIPFVLLMLVNSALAHTGENDFAHHGMMGGIYGGFGMGFFGWLIWLLIAVALILLIAWLIKQLSKKK